MNDRLAGKNSRRMTRFQPDVAEDLRTLRTLRILRILKTVRNWKLSLAAALGISNLTGLRGLFAEGARQCIWISREGVSQLDQHLVSGDEVEIMI